MPDFPTLVIGDNEIGQWFSVTVRRDLNNIVGVATLVYKAQEQDENRPDKTNTITDITELLDSIQSDVSIMLGDTLVMKGDIFGYAIRRDQNTSEIEVTIRTRTADLADSNIGSFDQDTFPEGEKITLSHFMRTVLKPYNGSVEVEYKGVDEQNLMITASQPSSTDSVYAFIDRVISRAKLTLSHTREGKLLITNLSTLQHRGSINDTDVQILSLQAVLRTEGLFSEYVIPAIQRDSSGVVDDDGTGGGKDVIVTSNVFGSRFRRVTMPDVDGADEGERRTILSYEVNRKIANAFGAELDLPQPTNSEGQLYELGDLYDVIIPYARLDLQLILGGLTFSWSSNGITASLALRAADGYSPDFTSTSDRPARKGVLD